MAFLPEITCDCGRKVQSELYVPNARGRANRASGYESCLRKCHDCGIGFSNANTKNSKNLTKILLDPFAGIPDWVKVDSDTALSQCLNQTHAAWKRTEFASLNSEDHVTWTVMRLLQYKKALGRSFGYPEIEPTMLLWGVPIPTTSANGWQLRDRLINVLNGLGEAPGSRSEPDVILDFGNSGLVFIEAKLFSPNNTQEPSYRGWQKYLMQAAFCDPTGTRHTGLYELARNWCIGSLLAEDRKFIFVNLAMDFSVSERRKLARLRSTFRRSPERRFTICCWAHILQNIDAPGWFGQYARRRGLTSMLRTV